jgi:hypothetical protein
VNEILTLAELEGLAPLGIEDEPAPTPTRQVGKPPARTCAPPTTTSTSPASSPSPSRDPSDVDLHRRWGVCPGCLLVGDPQALEPAPDVRCESARRSGGPR